MINIDDLTIGQARELASMFQNHTVSCDNSSAWELGEYYLIRTVTMIDTGKVIAVTPNEIVLEEAAWIADTGRFSDTLKSLEFSEIEPFPDGRVIIGRGAIIDAVKITGSPRIKK